MSKPLLLALAATLAAVPCLGQPAAPAADEPPSQIFVESLNVHVVNIDVYVTDKDGRPVTDLEREEFELYEDGRPVEITNFLAVVDGEERPDEPERRLAAAEEVPEAPRPQVAREPAPEPAPGLDEEERLHLVVYVDNVNIRPHNRTRVLRELRTFLTTQLTPQDRVMLVSFDRSITVRRNLTSDPLRVAQALSELDKTSGLAVHDDSQRRDVLERINEAESPEEAYIWAQRYAEAIRNDVELSIEALREVVLGLAGVPGRKAIVYVSDGLPMIPGEDIFNLIMLRFNESTALTRAGEFNGARRFQEIAAQANANRITFYTIDARGLMAPSASNVDDRGTSQAARSAYVDQIHLTNLQAPIQLIAEETGGRSIVNANRVLPDLDRVAQDFRHYYSLGYSPASSLDGRYHDIEVKVKRKGVRVRYRKGYRYKSPEARMADGTRSALEYDFESNPLGLMLELGRPVPQEDGFYVLPMKVRVPLSRLVLVENGEYHQGRLRLWLAARDEKGGEAEVAESEVPVSIPAAVMAEADGKNFAFPVNMLMRPGLQKVAIGVRDDLGSRSSFVTRQVQVGKRMARRP